MHRMLSSAGKKNRSNRFDGDGQPNSQIRSRSLQLTMIIPSIHPVFLGFFPLFLSFFPFVFFSFPILLRGWTHQAWPRWGLVLAQLDPLMHALIAATSSGFFRIILSWPFSCNQFNFFTGPVL